MYELRKLIKMQDIVGKLYIVIFVLIMFSGSTFISEYVMPLICLLNVLLILMVYVKGINKNAIVNRSFILLRGLFIIFIILICCQIKMAYDPSIVKVFLMRFIAYYFCLKFISNSEVNYTVIKSVRIYSFVVAISILFSIMISGTKSGGLVGNYQYAGMMMSIGCGVFLIDYYYNSSKINIFGMILCVLALASSGKRTFTFIAILSYLFVFITTNKKNRWKKLFVISGFIGVVAIPVIILVPSLQTVLLRFISYSGDSTFNGRNYYWDVALQIFEKHKLIGIGIGNFSTYFKTFYYRYGNLEAYDAHNTYIQLLAEMGISGTVVFVLILVIALYSTLKLYTDPQIKHTLQDRYILIYATYMQLWFIIYAFTGNPLHGANQFFFYVSAVAMVISLNIRYKKQCVIIRFKKN